MSKNAISWIVITVLIIGLFGWYTYEKNGSSVSSVTGPSKYDSFAQCLAQKDATMYGAVWCPHCQAQKARFGSAFKYVKYVECPDNVALCEAKGITGYPTWIFSDGSKQEGEMELGALAQKTSCQLPQ